MNISRIVCFIPTQRLSPKEGFETTSKQFTLEGCSLLINGRLAYSRSVTLRSRRSSDFAHATVCNSERRAPGNDNGAVRRLREIQHGVQNDIRSTLVSFGSVNHYRHSVIQFLIDVACLAHKFPTGRHITSIFGFVAYDMRADVFKVPML